MALLLRHNMFAQSREPDDAVGYKDTNNVPNAHVHCLLLLFAQKTIFSHVSAANAYLHTYLLIQSDFIFEKLTNSRLLCECKIILGHGGALVESIAFNQRVVGSTPAVAAM